MRYKIEVDLRYVDEDLFGNLVAQNRVFAAFLVRLYMALIDEPSISSLLHGQNHPEVKARI